MRPGFAGRWFSSRAGRIFVAAAAWTAVGVFFAVPGMATGPNWRHALLQSLAQWWAWGLVAPLIVALDGFLPSSDRQLARRTLLHLLLSFPVTAAYFHVFAAVLALLGLESWRTAVNPQLVLTALRGMFLWSWLVYWVIVGAWQAYRYYGRYLSTELRMERLERRFTEARLNVLRMQLDPHFLFNALNTISSQVERDPRLARAMIEHLGDLLRMSLETRDKQEIPLVEELAFLDHYLAIQRIRFGDHLKIEIRVDADVKYALVPSLILQPLVENAIRHGLSPRSSGGTIVISARRVSGQLEIRVLDDGVGLPTGWALGTSPGLGLTLTRDRIAGLHGGGSSHFGVRRLPGGGTEVEIRLPMTAAEEELDHVVPA